MATANYDWYINNVAYRFFPETRQVIIQEREQKKSKKFLNKYYNEIDNSGYTEGTTKG